MENQQKEVWFNLYCKHCKFKNDSEEHPTCADCLAQPANENSHKPVNYLWDGIGEEPKFNSTDERESHE